MVDVARAAGVALGTVSRVLNNHPEVNDEMRHRVLQTAQDLKYTRIRRRRASMRSSGDGPAGTATGNIAVICFGMEDALGRAPSPTCNRRRAAASMPDPWEPDDFPPVARSPLPVRERGWG